MRNSIFVTAVISTGSYNNVGYSKKEYGNLAAFKRGLKAHNCPYSVDESGLFFDVGGRLSKREWNFFGQHFTASVNVIR
jgi:hypothetical protein